MNRTLYFVLLVVCAPLVMAAVCQNPNETLNQIRRVHSTIRAAFVAADDFVAPRFEAAGDVCIAWAEEQGLTGRAMVESSNACMRPWLILDETFTLVREALAGLERVYNNIKAGTSGVDDWVYWGRQVLGYGQTILRVLTELALDGANQIISDLRTAVDNLCDLVHCDGGA